MEKNSKLPVCTKSFRFSQRNIGLRRTMILLVLIIFQIISINESALGQQHAVTGTIKDEKGIALTGVTVKLKGTNTVTITDINGKYNLANVPSSATLVFSFVGMNSQEVEVKGQSNVDVTLTEASVGLDEVVVIAYGSTSKRALIGSTSTISSGQLSKVSTSSLTQSLEGLSAGVQVFSTDGTPGTEAQVLVRGITSFNASNDPLYIVDGAPYTGNLNQIPSADIESISVLKDAAANSLYGSRASGGVILITTKKGKDSNGAVHFNAKWGVTDFAVPFPKSASPQETYELQWRGLYQGQLQNGIDDVTARNYATNNVVGQFFPQFNSTIRAATGRIWYNSYDTDTPVGTDGKLKSDAKVLWPQDNFDWYNALFRKGTSQEYNIDFSGKVGGKTNYYFSANYLDDKGLYTTQEFNRVSARLNLTTDVKSWLRIGTNFSFAHSFQNDAQAYVRFYRTMPSVNGVWVWDYVNNDYWLDSNGNKIPDNAFDPNSDKTRLAWLFWEQQRQGKYKNNYGWNFTGLFNDNFNTSDYIEADIIKGMKFKSMVAITYGLDRRMWFTSIYSDKAGSGNNYVQNNSNISVTWNNLLTYEKSFGLHNLNFLVGQELFDQQWSYLGAGKKGYPMDGLWELDAATTPTAASSSFDQYKLLSFFARAEYNYDNKYYAGSSIRRDGSSRFHPDSRWGTFWSGSLAWRISKENFMKDISWIDDLRIKGSIGSVGNDKVSLYAYQGLYSSNPDLNNTGYLMSKLATPALKWEKNIQTNIGVDIRVLKRLGISVEYFIKKSQDLLFDVPLPLSSGFEGISQNIGDLSNKGVEATIDYQVLKVSDFKWDVSLNMTHIKNRIDKLPNEWNPVQGNFYRGVGNSMYDWYAPVWAGLTDQGRNSWYLYTFKTDANGDYIRGHNGDKIVESQTVTTNYKDVNNTTQRRIVGSSIPTLYGSFSNNFGYKGIDFSFSIFYSFGQTMYDGDFRESTRWRPAFAVTENWNKYSWDLNGNDPKSLMPRLSEQDYKDGNTGTYSTQYLFKNNYARLRNITIGYTLPKNITKKAGLEALRVYFSGENLFTLAKAIERGTDPAVALNATVANGNDGNGSFSSRKFMTYGLNLTF